MQKQGYALGQIRGGISVTMPASQLLEMRDFRSHPLRARYTC
jgi:hypothetical protein